MKIVKQLLILLVLFSVQVYAVAAFARLGSMRVSLIENELQIRSPETGKWDLAAINTPLDEGDEIWVPQGGRAELQLNADTSIRLDENTALHILSLDEDSSQFYLSQGSAYINFNASRGNVIQVDTPDASIRAFDRVIFSCGMPAQNTEVSVFKGYVLAENRAGETRINAGEMLSLGKNTSGTIAATGYPDAWVTWNQSRDQTYRARESSAGSRYLPSELRTYSPDLESNGRWVYVSDYGYVWSPRTFISEGWTPYREGRWCWRGGDYIWVPSEPWGWVPYHYGRWGFFPSIGWFWVPPPPGDVYWGPGYVGWVRSDDYVAWVPLAPGEIYYGRGYYGPRSVNITNVNINEIHVTNIYKNVTVINGPIIVEKRSFVQGAPTHVHIDQQNIYDKVFTTKNIRFGGPDIKPAKEQLFAGGREIPMEKLPPKSVREQYLTDLKNSRRLMKEQNRSVFNPDAEPKVLTIRKENLARTPEMGRPPGQLEKPLVRPDGVLDTRQGHQPPPEEQSQFRGTVERRDSKKEINPPPMVVPEDGHRAREKERRQPVQLMPPEEQPQYRGNEGRRDIRRDMNQPTLSPPVVVPGDGHGAREKVRQQPVQLMPPEEQPQYRGNEGRRDIRKEMNQPLPRMGVPGDEHETKGKARKPPGDPQCGPGQKDQHDPKKCPQNFQIKPVR